MGEIPPELELDDELLEDELLELLEDDDDDELVELLELLEEEELLVVVCPLLPPQPTSVATAVNSAIPSVRLDKAGVFMPRTP